MTRKMLALVLAAALIWLGIQGAGIVISSGIVAVPGMSVEHFQALVSHLFVVGGAFAAFFALLWAVASGLANRVLRDGAGHGGWLLSGLLALVSAIVLYWVMLRYWGPIAVLSIYLICVVVVYYAVSAVAAPWSHAYVPPGAGQLRTTTWRALLVRGTRRRT
jgi:hypothetical protein